jgi:Bacteriophage replication protein O
MSPAEAAGNSPPTRRIETMPNQQQFVKYPKDLLAWRRFLSGNAWTVLTVIIDKTSGWDKESDAVSLSQIEAETTLKRSAIQRALAELQREDGPVEMTGRGPRGIPVYRTRPCYLPAGEQGVPIQHTCPLVNNVPAGEHHNRCITY